MDPLLLKSRPASAPFNGIRYKTHYQRPQFGFNLGCEFCQYSSTQRGETRPDQLPVCPACHSFCYIKFTIEERVVGLDGAGPSSQYPGQILRRLHITLVPFVSEDPESADIRCLPDARFCPLTLMPQGDDALYTFLKLPNEVLVHIFQKLDDIGLCAVSTVCTRFNSIAKLSSFKHRFESSLVPWTNIVDLNTRNCDLIGLCGTLYSTINCVQCFRSTLTTPVEDRTGSSWLKRMSLEKGKSGPAGSCSEEGVNATPQNASKSHWLARINGPPDSPYQNGVFYLHVFWPPFHFSLAPTIKFITKIFHPNISRHGEFGAVQNVIGWTSSLTIRDLLVSIRGILGSPNVCKPMHRESARLYMTDVDKFNIVARKWTVRYGMLDRRVSGVFKL